jgi:hypothetical protein
VGLSLLSTYTTSTRLQSHHCCCVVPFRDDLSPDTLELCKETDLTSFLSLMSSSQSGTSQHGTTAAVSHDHGQHQQQHPGGGTVDGSNLIVNYLPPSFNENNLHVSISLLPSNPMPGDFPPPYLSPSHPWCAFLNSVSAACRLFSLPTGRSFMSKLFIKKRLQKV